MLGSALFHQHAPPVASSGGNLSDPVVLDLLRELKQAKEDAAWAKNRLAEMIVLVNQNKSEPYSSSSSSSGVGAGNRYSSTSSGGSGGNQSNRNVYSKRGGGVPHSQSEDAYEDIVDEEDEYSNDFETSMHSNNLNGSQDAFNSSMHRFRGKDAALNRSGMQSGSALKENRVNQFGGLSSSASSSSTTQQQQHQQQQQQQQQQPQRDEVLAVETSPSLLSSQALFRRQLTSLRQRLALTTSSTAPLVPLGQGNGVPTMNAAPTLQQLKSQFEEKRAQQKDRVWELLMERDPEMTETQAKTLAERFARGPL